ncbi:MAG TPA: hypothetical protein VKR32_02270 [Puia sp.]|nr:hypothetical protein [Puia sp.]
MQIRKRFERLLQFALLLNCRFAPAQIEAYQDAHHHVVFANKLIRVLDLRIPENDTTAEHRHSLASVVIFLTRTSFTIKNKSGPPVNTDVDIGSSIYRDYGRNPVTHRVWHDGKTEFRCLVIEILDSAIKNPVCSEPAGKGIRKDWSENQASLFDWPVGPGGNFTLAPSECPTVIVCITGTVNVQTGEKAKLMRSGEFIFVPSGQKTQIASRTAKGAKVELIQIK